jgi:uncharacterized membrane protein (DUF4010 family)
MLTIEVVKEVVLALLLGSVIGLQREHVKHKGEQPKFAGIRTFMLISLLGALSIHLAEITMMWLFGAITILFIVFVVVAYMLESHHAKDIGATTEVASIITFFIGAFCALGYVYTTVFIAIATASILAFKELLHKFAHRVNEQEIYSTLKFSILAFIILPLLPNKGYGPYEVFNPFIIMLMIVLILGISFVAYILIKLFGAKKGIGITGALGGIVSSTAITTSLSAQSKKNKKGVNPYVFGIVIAGTMMFPRVFFEVWVLNKELLGSLLLPLGASAVVGLLSSYVLWRRKDPADHDPDVKVTSPFTFGPAIKFGLLFAAVLFLAKSGQVVVGEKAIYGVSVLSGLADVDAMTVSASNFAKSGQISNQVAVYAIMLAIAANTFFKAIIVFFLGSREVAKRVAGVFFLMILSGALTAFFVGVA